MESQNKTKTKGRDGRSGARSRTERRRPPGGGAHEERAFVCATRRSSENKPAISTAKRERERVNASECVCVHDVGAVLRPTLENELGRWIELCEKFSCNFETITFYF